ncbi:MAG: hypothetical protein ACREBR_00665 [bacterium]
MSQASAAASAVGTKREDPWGDATISAFDGNLRAQRVEKPAAG